MVVTPGIQDLPYIHQHGEKVFELIAEEIEWEILDNVIIKAWGYNGSTPGPTIRVYPGDWVRIRVTNHLPERTSVHWHGLEVPNTMDGVPAVEPTPYIEPGESFEYHFRITNPPGTYMYHSHVNVLVQDNFGLLGGFIIEDPSLVHRKKYKDYLILLQEWSLKDLPVGTVTKGTYPLSFDHDSFNFFTMNGKCFPSTHPLPVTYGDFVRIRYGNIQMHHHPIHLHGHQFRVMGADGYPIKRDHQVYKNTILVASGETWDIGFEAKNPGIWPLHCHMPHHVTNNGTQGTGGMFTTVTYETYDSN